jgi:hypothetical protein
LWQFPLFRIIQSSHGSRKWAKEMRRNDLFFAEGRLCARSALKTFHPASGPKNVHPRPCEMHPVRLTGPMVTTKVK